MNRRKKKSISTQSPSYWRLNSNFAVSRRHISCLIYPEIRLVIQFHLLLCFFPLSFSLLLEVNRYCCLNSLCFTLCLRENSFEAGKEKEKLSRKQFKSADPVKNLKKSEGKILLRQPRIVSSPSFPFSSIHSLNVKDNVWLFRNKILPLFLSLFMEKKRAEPSKKENFLFQLNRNFCFIRYRNGREKELNM